MVGGGGLGEEGVAFLAGPHDIQLKTGTQFRDNRALDFYLQERANLFSQLQKALLTLVQGSSDGHAEPLSHCLGVALVEEVCGRAVLGMDAVLQRLGQEDRAGADGAVCGKERSQSLPEGQ